MTIESNPGTKHEYLAAYCLSKEALWCMVRARSAQEVVKKYPLLIIAREKPAGLTEEFVSKCRSYAFDIDDAAPKWLELVHEPMDWRIKFELLGLSAGVALCMAVGFALLVTGIPYLTGSGFSFDSFVRWLVIMFGPFALLSLYWFYDHFRMTRRVASEEAIKADQEKVLGSGLALERGVLARTFRPDTVVPEGATRKERIGFRAWSIARGLSFWVALLTSGVVLLTALNSTTPVALSVVAIILLAFVLAPTLTIWTIGRGFLFLLTRR